MIIWLASYPKSGNTWVRNILNQIIYNDIKDKSDIFKNLSRIKRYPSRMDIKDLPAIPSSGNYNDEQKKLVIDHTIKNWEISQMKINYNNKINVLKTHNMLCKIKLKNEDFLFTNKKNSIGVIHIVRDPRNILTSIKNHYSHTTQEQSLDMLFNEFNWIGFKNHDIPQFLSSWSNHYNSWKRFPLNYFLIKYEDLLENPKKEISRIINYLSKFFELNISNKKIDLIIENTSFDNFSIQEEKGEFEENAKNELGERKKFFYLGPKNDWKNYVKSENAAKIAQVFKKEMRELGYL